MSASPMNGYRSTKSRSPDKSTPASGSQTTDEPGVCPPRCTISIRVSPITRSRRSDRTSVGKVMRRPSTFFRISFAQSESVLPRSTIDARMLSRFHALPRFSAIASRHRRWARMGQSKSWFPQVWSLCWCVLTTRQTSSGATWAAASKTRMSAAHDVVSTTTSPSAVRIRVAFAPSSGRIKAVTPALTTIASISLLLTLVPPPGGLCV